MDSVIVGDGLVKIHDVVREIEESPSFPLLVVNWRSFARCIGLKDIDVVKLQTEVDVGTISIRDVPREICRLWKACNGSRATLKVLCDALIDCGLRHIAETLSQKYCQSEPVKSSKQYAVQGKVYTLEQLVENSGPERFQSPSKPKGLSGTDMPESLIRKEFSPHHQPDYYISRAFLFVNELDEKIFTDNSLKEHIVVVKGASKFELAQVIGLQMIEGSRNQLDKITARIILLECDEDFSKICAKTTKPVHLIEHKVKKFFWITSTQSLEVIRNFLKGSGHTFDEDEVVSKIISQHSHSAICIADSPGTGKSLVLQNLAFRTKQRCDNSIVLLVGFQEFIDQMHLLEPSSPLDSVLSFVCTNSSQKAILQEMLKRKTFQFFFFFDGYDEVSQSQIDFADTLLYHLTQLSNVKVIVTTRPHLTLQLENVMKTFSLKILPFTNSDQANFLTKYWICKYGAKKGKILQEFAQRCLQNFKMRASDKQNDFAALPLHSRVLADVLAEQALRISKLDILPDDSAEDLFVFNVYKNLIDLKFSKISNSLRLKSYVDFHIHESIALLFPDWLEKFKPHLTKSDKVNVSTVYAIGLMEQSLSSRTSIFVHKTYAEYMIADYLVKNLDKHKAFVEFFIQEILRAVEDSGRPGTYTLVNFLMAYFANMFLQNHFKDNDPNEFAFLNSLNLESITAIEICTAANACCSSNLESCFVLIAHIAQHLRIRDYDELKDKYFKHLPHRVVHNTNNLSLLKKVLNFTKSNFGADLSYHIYHEDYHFGSDPEIPNSTPLHVAVMQGKYNMFMYLLNEYGQQILSVKYLLHACVYDSAGNSDLVIEEKLSIIEALTQTNAQWLKEKLGDRTPLIQRRVHVKLLHQLINLGANINAYSINHGTILHTAGDKKSYFNLVRLALNNGFNLVNHTDYQGLNPLMKAIKNYGTVDDEVLELLSDAGTDFNAQDSKGDSVFFYAIENYESLFFIRKLLYFGANPNHRNVNGRNASHLIMSNCQNYPNQILDLLKLVKSKGFVGLDDKDIYGYTPLMIGLDNENVLRDEVLHFFFEEGVDFNAVDKYKNSVLFYVVQNSKLIQKLLEFGANPKHRCSLGRNIGHLIMRRCHVDTAWAIDSLKLLESQGFNGLNDKDNDECTPIMDAIDAGGKIPDEILQYLSEAGVDFNAVDYNGDSVLFYCIKISKCPDFLKSIVELGADPNHKNFSGQSAADIIIELHLDDQSTVLKLLEVLISKEFEGFNQSVSGIKNFNRIIAQLQKEIVKPEILALFFKTASKGVDKYGETILFHAVRFFKSVALIRLMLEEGVNANHQNCKGETVAHLILHYFLEDPKLGAILEILETYSFKCFNTQDNDGCTPIMKAIKYGKVFSDRVLSILKDVGVDFNAKDESGDSVLFYAIKNSNNLHFVRMILDLGANLNHKNKFGSNACHLILKHHHHNDIDLTINLLKLLETYKFQLFNAKDNEGLSPILKIIESGDVLDDEILQFLQKLGVDFNDQDVEGDSVLFYAIVNSRNLYFIQKILDLGADPNHKNKIGRNAAHLIFQSYFYYQLNPNFSLDILKMLKSVGFIGFNEKDSLGNTPLELARKNKVMYKPVLKFLWKELSNTETKIIKTIDEN